MNLHWWGEKGLSLESHFGFHHIASIGLRKERPFNRCSMKLYINCMKLYMKLDSLNMKILQLRPHFRLSKSTCLGMELDYSTFCKASLVNLK